MKNWQCLGEKKYSSHIDGGIVSYMWSNQGRTCQGSGIPFWNILMFLFTGETSATKYQSNLGS